VLCRGRNGFSAVIFVHSLKTDKNGIGGCRDRFVTAEIPGVAYLSIDIT